MLKCTKGLMLIALSLMLNCASVAVADSVVEKHREDKSCNGHKHHPDKYIGVYYRSDVPPNADIPPNPILVSIPVITLNEDGTAIIYFGESLLEFITQGTASPSYGNWQALKHHQVLVMTLGFQATETPNTTPPVDTFGALRITYLLDFSQSLNSPKVIARSTVDLTGVPASDWLNPLAGTLLFNNPINPRQLQRICAFDTDLTRPM